MSNNSSGNKREYHRDNYDSNNRGDRGDYRPSASSYKKRNYKKPKYDHSDDNHHHQEQHKEEHSSLSTKLVASSSSNDDNYTSKHPFSIRNVTKYLSSLSCGESPTLCHDNNDTNNDSNNNSNSNNSNNVSQNVIRNYMAKYRKIPKGWPQVSPLFGELIPNTKFIPLKCPLSPQFFKFPNNVSISLIQEHFNTNFSQEIGMIIDLCCVEFYKKNDIPSNMKYLSYYMNIHDLNKNSDVKPFTEQMDTIVDNIDTFIENNPSKYILVHCTHGLNRTGFVICYYLLKKKIVNNVQQAIEIFKTHRKTKTGLYNPFFIDLLFEMFDQTDSDMYQLMKYPDPVPHSRKSIKKELKHYKPWLKRKNQFDCFDHYQILRSTGYARTTKSKESNKRGKSDNDSSLLSEQGDNFSDNEEFDDEELTRK